MATAALTHPVVDAVLSCAAAVLDMEVAFVGGLTEDTFTFERLHGQWPGIMDGLSCDRTDSLCHRMLAGSAQATSDAMQDPAFCGALSAQELGITSYVGVPIRDGDGHVVATLCGIDRRPVPIDRATVDVLSRLAKIVETHLGSVAGDSTVIRRTPEGWRVGAETTPDLTSAMVLADLLADELGRLDGHQRPPRPTAALDELGRLRLSVAQLEHALAARVVVEQAIGVLAERQHAEPRAAFDRLRRVARSRGRKVHDLAREVVASTATGVPLPPELAGSR